MIGSPATQHLIKIQAAAFALASALCVSGVAQQPAVSASANAPSSSSADAQSSASSQGKLSTPPKEGFWGRINPMARKKWVNKQLDPIKGQLNELDEVNAKNAADIKDVDARAQAGISKAQASADQANQVASAANDSASKASMIAGQANGQVSQLSGTVSGLDNYAEKNTISISFKRGSTVLSSDAKSQLDDLATKLVGHQGYLLEVEAHAPMAGSVGIQSSDRLAEAVERYLVTQHEIPVYRMHSVALGNAPVADSGNDKPVHTSYVSLRLLENSLAAKDSSPAQPGAAVTGGAQQ